MRNTIHQLSILFILLFFYSNPYEVRSVAKMEIPKIEVPALDPEKLNRYGQEFGRATGKGLAETVTQFLRPAKKKPELSTSEKTQHDFILTIFDGKKVAIPKGEINTVRTVKLNKAYFNTSALMASVVSDSLEMVEYLLNNNADTDVQNKDGITALHIAARAGKKTMVKKLLTHGANPDIQDKHSMTPLMYAVMKKSNQDHYDVIKTLLHHGADSNLINYKGSTALMMASANNDYAVAKLLLKHHANPLTKDAQGRTAFDLTNDKKLKETLLISQFSYRPVIKEQEEEFFPVFGGPDID